MGWIDRIRRVRAAKQYARKLPKALMDGWGASKYYTPAQIKVAARKMKLDMRFIAIGFAAFLPEEKYAVLTNEMPATLAYGEAQALFQRFTHWTPASASGNAPERLEFGNWHDPTT